MGIAETKRTLWEQELNVDGGFVRTTAVYQKVKELMVTFVPFNHNLVVVHKKLETVESVPDDLQLTFRYVLHETRKVDKPPHGMSIDPVWNPKLSGVEVFYKVDGVREYEGLVIMFSDVDVSARVLNNWFELCTNFHGEGEATFYLLFVDNETADYIREARRIVKAVRQDGYSRVFERHLDDWGGFLGLLLCGLARQRFSRCVENVFISYTLRNN